MDEIDIDEDVSNIPIIILPNPDKPPSLSINTDRGVNSNPTTPGRLFGEPNSRSRSSTPSTEADENSCHGSDINSQSRSDTEKSSTNGDVEGMGSPSAEKPGFLRKVRRSISFSPMGKTRQSSASVDSPPPFSPGLRSSLSDPSSGSRLASPGKPSLRSKSVTSLDKTVKHTRRQSTSVSAIKQASHMTVKNIEAVTCIFKVTVGKLIFPENKGLAHKLAEGTNIQVIFERGDRNVKSYERPLVLNRENGSMEVEYNEALSLTLTMYRNPSTNKYHERKGKLLIVQEKKKTRMKRLFSQPYKEIGTVQFDLTKVFEDYISTDRVLGVTQCPIPGTTVRVTLQPKVIGEDMAHFAKPRVDKDKGEDYVGEYNMDKKHGRGKMTYADGSYYDGQWRNDKMHGKGTFVTADNEVYVGDYVEGVKHGRGHTTFPDGSFYAGDYQQGTVCGRGEFIADGDIYEGEWEDNMEHGRGKLTYATGDVYEGDFSDDMKHGNGELNTASGDHYSGNFRDDAINGMGTYKWVSGDEYTGLWENGKMHGYGEYKWVNGDIYRGNWRHNQKHGTGEFIADNGRGDRFTGTFQNDHKSSGRYEFSDGDVYEGEYESDQQDGPGVMMYANGDRYEGDFARNMKHGEGVFQFANGSVYDGEYADDHMHGCGKYKSHMGDSYEGEYVHNRRCGYGKYFYHDGSYYEGNWQDNMKHGEGFYRWPNGNSFTGEFNNDQKASKGQYAVVYNVE